MNRAARTGRRIHPEVVSWLGLGLVGGAMLLALFDTVRFSAVGADLQSANNAPWWWVPVPLGALVLGQVLWRHLRNPDPGPAERHSRGRTVFLLAVSALSAGVTLTSFSPEPFAATARTPRTYDPDPVGVSLWLVPLTITLGLVLTVAAGHRPRLAPAHRSMPFFAAGLALVVPCEVALNAATLYQPTEHVVADAFPDAPAPVPSTISEVGWTWRPPEDATVQAVESGPLGPLLVLQDGVVALDGASGAELWSYRHPYSEVSAMVADDGATAVIARQPAADQFGDRQVTEVDTATGRVVDGFTVPSLRSEDDGLRVSLLAATQDLRFHSWDEPGERYRISARASRSGQQVWAFTLPVAENRVCATDSGWRAGENVLLVDDRLVVVYACADSDQLEDTRFLWDAAGNEEASVTVTVAALDPGSGEVVWEREREAAGENGFHLSTHRPLPGGGGRAVVAVHSDHGRGLPLVLDPRDGARVSDPPSELTAPEGKAAQAFEALVHADSNGTVLLARGGDGREGADEAPWEFVRASPTGRVTGTGGDRNT